MTTETATERPAIVCEGVQKRFGDTIILDDIDLRVETGAIIGLVGPSGSGKTTLVRLLNGVYRPDEGSVEVLGEAPTERPSARRTAIGYLPQDPVLFEELSLWENLNFHASMNGVPFRRRARLHSMLELVDLEGQEKKLVSESSGGMKRRLGLAASMVHDPELLMLDEPTAGVDPILRSTIWDRFHELAADGTTIVITTQFVEEAAYCDLVGVLANGRLQALGTPAELRQRAAEGAPAGFDAESSDWNEIFVRLVGGDEENTDEAAKAQTSDPAPVETDPALADTETAPSDRAFAEPEPERSDPALPDPVRSERVESEESDS